MKRLLAFVLSILLLLSFCGCRNIPVETTVPTQTTQVLEPTETTQPTDAVGRADAPNIQYTLTDADVNTFYSLLQESEEMALNSNDIDAVDAITSELDEQYTRLADQAQIAYVLYCCDITNDVASQNYLSATEICAKANNDYLEMVRRVYLSDCPAKDMLFEDWTETDIAQLLAYDEQVMELENRNAQILVDYRALSQEELAQGMIPLYNELVKNNNTIAKIYGYDDYYDYAYEMVYSRDYGPQQVKTIRQLVQKYIARSCGDAYQNFAESYNALETLDQVALTSFMMDDYDISIGDYVPGYLASLPQEARAVMEDALAGENVWFSRNLDALEGAFTTQFEDRCFCFFGPGYQSCMTVVHELGHYFGGQYNDSSELPLDLAELQSQGNEWLLLAWLREQMDSEVYSAFFDYKLYENLSTVVICIIIDCFEQQVYKHPNAGNLTLEQYDAIMETVCADFGGMEYLNAYISDVQQYWKQVVLESPVYYMSYGVSMVAAMNLYTIALDDPDKAMEIYVLLNEKADCEQGFLANIEQAGLPGPFDENVYKDFVSFQK